MRGSRTSLRAKRSPRLSAVGPTSTDRQLLRGTLALARERFAGAEIAPWSHRARTVAQIKGWADALRRETAAADAADQASVEAAS